MTTTKENTGLAGLFASSSGPLKKPERPERPEKKTEEVSPAVTESKDETKQDSDEESEASDSDMDVDDEVAAIIAAKPSKKAKKIDQDESADVEDRYMAKLADEVVKDEQAPAVAAATKDEIEADESDSEPELDVDEATKKKLEAANKELDKADYTVFVGNVPCAVITDKEVYKQFKELFKAVGTVASIRFRSISFAELLPRKVAFISQKFHSKRDTVNAYVVFKNKKSVKGSLALNSTVFKAHHLRVDSIAHPGVQDHKRCVFVGALDFEEQEEALWEAFSGCGQVEYVRIVRDSKTNVGKGFAYVQFQDAASVDKALLHNGKGINELSKSTTTKRKLRVSRAKSQHAQDRSKQSDLKRTRDAKTEGLTRDERSHLGRAQARLGKAGKAQVQSIVQEGLRAKKEDSKVNLARGKKQRGAKPSNRVDKPGQSRAEKRKAQFGGSGPGAKPKKKRLTSRSQKFKQDGGVKKGGDDKKE